MTRLRRFALAALVALPTGAAAQPVVEAGGLRIADGYAISSGPSAPAGAAFMTITNTTGAADRLLAAETPAARRVELHTHLLEDGVARMVALDDGVPLPAGETVVLERGGLHVMLMGLTGPLEDGAAVKLTLIFETAGRVEMTVPVDRGHARPGH